MISMIMSDGGEANFIPFRYQGQFEDVETGLYYNRFRYYDPVIGQYTQQDPIGLAGNNPTLYGYVFNPLCQIDSFGLDWNYILEDILGQQYYNGRAADSAAFWQNKKVNVINEKLTALQMARDVTDKLSLWI